MKTPARYFIPNKEAVEYPEGLLGRQVCTETAAGKREYKARTYAMEVRQSFRCAICERTAGSSMEFDHQDGRGHGGGFRNDAILDVDGNRYNAALCHSCNTLKGSKRYHWLNGKYVSKSQEDLSREVA